MNKLLLLTLFFSYTLRAETVPLPTSVLGVDDITQEVKGSFTTKISALGKNYITRVSNQAAIYTSHETVSCNGIISQPGEPLAKIQYASKQNNQEIIEKGTYSGCNGEVFLVEDVVSRGANLSPLPMKDFLEGKRTIDLKDNEVYRLYKLSNGEGEEIFKVLVERTQTGKSINYFFAEQKILSMIYEYKTSSTRLSITYYGYSVNYNFKRSKWRYNYNFTPYSNIVMASTSAEDSVIYLGQNNNRLSLSAFIVAFNESVMKYTIAAIASIMEDHILFFPKTETTQTGAQSQRFLEELRIAQNRLLNNMELNLVKNLLQEYVNAAEKGLIIDNRPKN